MKESFQKALTEFIVKFFGDVEGEQPVEKVTEQMISYEVVYEPNTKDAHGQWMSPETLELACENFNSNLQNELDVKVVGTEELIKAGTWVAKIKYNDEALWSLKKAGVIQGVSIGARGVINETSGEITNVTFDGDNNAA